MDDLQKILKEFKDKLLKIKEIRKSMSDSDIDKIRTYIKYNRPLEHLTESSFSLRSILEEQLHSSSIDEAVESIEDLIEGYNEYLGEED